MKTICGLDCDVCWMKDRCAGCAETDGRPFGGTCLLGECCKSGTCPNSGHAFENHQRGCPTIQKLAAEFNALGIPDMEPVTELHTLHGAYINLSYTLPGGQEIQFWDDSRMYLGNQMPKRGTDRCYGLAADENFLLVCEYGPDGSDAEIVVYKRRK